MVKWVSLLAFSLVAMKAWRQFDREAVRKLAAVAGILIVAVFAAVQVVHAHPGTGLADNAHCAVCAIAHTSATVIAPVSLLAIVFTHLRLALFEPPLRQSLVLRSLYSRPPPPTA